jgi:hypothetical protein
MSRLEEVMNEVEQESENIDTSPQNEGTGEHPASESSVNDVGVDEGTEQNQVAEKPEKKSFTKEERMTHSFKRQLNRQRKKYEGQISAFAERIQALENKLQENLGAMDETEKKTLEIERLVAERMQKHAQEQKQMQESYSAQVASTQEKIRKNFSSQEEIQAFQTMVAQAMEHPVIGEIFATEEAAALMDIVNESEISPRMLQYFIAKPEDFERILDLEDPTEQKIEVRMLERGLKNYLSTLQTQNPQTQNPPKTNVPVTGAIGRTPQSTNAEEDPLEMYRRLTGRG